MPFLCPGTTLWPLLLPPRLHGQIPDHCRLEQSGLSAIVRSCKQRQRPQGKFLARKRLKIWGGDFRYHGALGAASARSIAARVL